MSVFVKICGMKSAEAVEAAVEAGADAVGFVFTRSSRQIKPEQAGQLAALVPPEIKRVAVGRHPSPELCREILDVLRPDCLQTDAEDFEYIDLPSDCEALPVYRNGHVPDNARNQSKLLFEGNVSGSGKTADWSEARALAAITRVMLAGGLNPENVARAITEVKPWGVDVSSGVESSPGVKDRAKIKEFVARARAVEQ